MLINGVEILTSKIIYGPTWYGIILWAFMLLLFFIFTPLSIDIEELWVWITTAICFVCFIICLILTFDNNPTFLNKPIKMEYTIEIINDNAWKEIGPNYNVKEKIYENKEIYIIEKDIANE